MALPDLVTDLGVVINLAIGNKRTRPCGKWLVSTGQINNGQAGMNQISMRQAGKMRTVWPAMLQGCGHAVQHILRLWGCAAGIDQSANAAHQGASTEERNCCQAVRTGPVANIWS